MVAALPTEQAIHLQHDLGIRLVLLQQKGGHNIWGEGGAEQKYGYRMQTEECALSMTA